MRDEKDECREIRRKRLKMKEKMEDGGREEKIGKRSEGKVV